jgi:hypothetical protein
MRSVAATPSNSPYAFFSLRVGRASGSGAAQIVYNLQQFAGKVRDGVLLGVLHAAFTLTTDIFGLGQRAH